MKKLVSIIPLLCVCAVIYVASTLISCKKEQVVTPTEEQSTLTARAYQPYNCTTTTAEAASIQLLNPLSPKSWFNLSFCFTPPQQNIPNPIVYTNGDSLPVSLQIFVNKVFVGPKNQFIDEKIDEYFYVQAIGAPWPPTRVTFAQKPNLQNGTFTFPINFKFVKRGYYNPFINTSTYIYDTVRYNWDAYDFGMHSATTNSYAYVRLVIKSDK